MGSELLRFGYNLFKLLKGLGARGFSKSARVYKRYRSLSHWTREGKNRQDLGDIEAAAYTSLWSAIRLEVISIKNN